MQSDSTLDLRLKQGTNPEIPCLTGVRAIAAWWVVVYHIRAAFLLGSPRIDQWIQGCFGSGYIGVDLFFCLSGFVIAYNYWDDFVTFQIGRYRNFLWMRLARMYPVHLATLLLSLALYAGAKWKGISLHFGSSWTASQFLQNLLLIHNWSLHPVLSWNYPAWSISCEWLAYLAFPLLVRALVNRRSALPLGAAMLVSLLFLCGSFQFQHWSPVGAGIPRIGANFFAGIVVFQMLRKLGSVAWSERLVNSSLVLAAACLAASLFKPDITPFWMVLVFPALLYGLADGGRVAAFLASGPLVFWGRVSYSLYMTHGLVIMVMSKVLPVANSYRGLSHTAFTLAVYLSTIGLAAVATYFLIEEPGRRWMRSCQKRRNPSREPAPITARVVNHGTAELQHAAN